MKIREPENLVVSTTTVEIVDGEQVASLNSITISMRQESSSKFISSAFEHDKAEESNIIGEKQLNKLKVSHSTVKFSNLLGRVCSKLGLTTKNSYLLHFKLF